MVLTELATADVVTASIDTDVREILDQMNQSNIGSVVITDGNEPVGIVTDRMIAIALRNVDSFDDITIEEIVTGDLVTISDDDTHFEALETMSNEGIRRLPIVDNDGALAGIITLDDLIVVITAELSNASDVIEQQAGPL